MLLQDAASPAASLLINVWIRHVSSGVKPESTSRDMLSGAEPRLKLTISVCHSVSHPHTLDIEECIGAL